MLGRNVALGIAADDLPKQGDFFDALLGQLAAFHNDILDAAAALLTPRVRYNAKGTILITTLHDTHKRGRRLCRVPIQQVLANRSFTFLFLGNFNHLFTPAREYIIQVISRSMKLL